MARGQARDFRSDMVEIGRHLYDRKLVVSVAGNISCRLRGDRILITATGVCLGKMKGEDLAIVDLDGNLLEGVKEPSSEVRMHLAVYEARPDVEGIVHTHSIYASALAYMKIHLKPVNPESQYILGDIPIVPYFKFGTEELAQAVRERLGNFRGVLLEQHGVLAVGENPWGATYTAELIEEVAKISYLVELLERLEHPR
ncbi:MAG: class II aldolase/adducin family protein [Actinomycetota bacterium]|nr:class II aldolase/adducin family protein [Actinomycetota bacterium]